MINLSVVLHGGDRWLYQWKSPKFYTLTQDCWVFEQYEDRDLALMEILSQKHTEESFIKALSELCWATGEILAVNVGQEECRSSGNPIRFVKVAFSLRSK